MFYQILLFMPLKLWSGLFCFFFSFTAFFSFSSRGEVQEGSLLSGHVCLRTPPEGAEPADSDTSRFIRSRVGAISSPSSQINGGWEDVEPAGSAARPLVWKWSPLMDRDVRPTSQCDRPPLLPPSFVFVTACFLLCTATSQLFVKVTVGVTSPAVFQRNSELPRALRHPEMCDVCSLSQNSILKSLNHWRRS